MIPRRGAPLTKVTRDGFGAMGAEAHEASQFNRMSWFSLYGKLAAALLAEEIATTPVMIWLEGDILVLEPIVELGLEEGNSGIYSPVAEPLGGRLVGRNLLTDSPQEGSELRHRGFLGIRNQPTVAGAQPDLCLPGDATDADGEILAGSVRFCGPVPKTGKSTLPRSAPVVLDDRRSW